MKCRYDREVEDYLVDGEPCRTDEYGDPTQHCTARLTCSIHVGQGERVCPRCIGRTRRDIRQVVELATLMLPAAIDGGVRSDAADFAGPAADPRAVRAVRFYVEGHAGHLYRTGKIDGTKYEKILDSLPDDDEWHPYSVLTRWQLMLSEDYDHPLPERMSIAGAGTYLDRHLHAVAQDPEQEYALLAREIRKVRNRLESILHNDTRPDRGAFCPDCKADGHGLIRLVREYAHWCEDEDCERFHYDNDSGDEWVCPRSRNTHRWTHEDYEKWIAPRRARSAS